MKNKRGFTLTELLAIIVILSLLALITSVTVTKIFKDSKEELSKIQISSIKSSAEAWGVENKDRLPNVSECKYITIFDLKEYGIIDSDINDPKTNEKISDDLKIKITTKMSKKGKLIYSYEIGSKNIDGCNHVYNKICTPVTTSTVSKQSDGTLIGGMSGDVLTGDEYICEVSPRVKYHFYVLSKEGNNVNLIMNQNLINNVAWISKEDYISSGGLESNYSTYGNSNRGPITIMNAIYDATKNWTNVPNINVNYTDEGLHYGGLVTNGSTTSITTKTGSVVKSYSNLKARIPTYKELKPLAKTISSDKHLTGLPSWIQAKNSYWLLTSFNHDTYTSFTAGYSDDETGDDFVKTALEGRLVIQLLEADLLYDSIIGDVNNDGKVDSDDITDLANYVAGTNKAINIKNADVFVDGKISLDDVTVLTQHVNGIEGYEKLPIVKKD